MGFIKLTAANNISTWWLKTTFKMLKIRLISVILRHHSSTLGKNPPKLWDDMFPVPKGLMPPDLYEVPRGTWMMVQPCNFHTKMKVKKFFSIRGGTELVEDVIVALICWLKHHPVQGVTKYRMTNTFSPLSSPT